MRKHLRPVIIIIVIALVSLAIYTLNYSGYFLTPRSREGKRILEKYLAVNHPKAKITGVKDVMGYHYKRKVEGGFDYATDYVEGYYLIGKDEYKFYVNVATGDIYTSEKLKEVKIKLANKFKTVLDLEWKSVNIDFKTSIEKQVAYGDKLILRDVFSSKLKDAATIENDLFNNKYTSFDLAIYYTGKNINKSDLENISKIRSKGRSVLSINHLTNSMDKELLNSDNISKLRKTFVNEDSVSEEFARFHFNTGRVEFKKWADSNDYSPLVLHYLKYNSVFKGKDLISEETYDIHNDLRIEFGDNSYIFYKINDKLSFDIIFKDISMFDNEKHIAIKNLMNKNDFISKYYRSHSINPQYLSKAQKDGAEAAYKNAILPKIYSLQPIAGGWVFEKTWLEHFEVITGNNAKQILKEMNK